MRSAPPLTLVPFTAAMLPAVEEWFRHPEVRRRLGGPEYPARQMLVFESGPGEEHRGREVQRVHSWAAVADAGVPLATIGGDVYDRWTRYDGSGDRPVVLSAEPGPAMGLGYVVDPQRWRQGIGRAVLELALNSPDVADVRLFSLGIDTDNEPSRRCAAAAGFAPDIDEPDWEDTVYYLLRR